MIFANRREFCAPPARLHFPRLYRPTSLHREVKWLSAKEAAETVQEPMLSEIIKRLAHKTVA
jgi:hypothetical protein